MGPLDILFGMLQRKQEEDAMRMPPRQDQLTPSNMSIFQGQQLREPARPDMPFRPPGQEGPMPPGAPHGGEEDVLFYPGRNVVEPPPGRGPLAQMFGKGPRG